MIKEHGKPGSKGESDMITADNAEGALAQIGAVVGNGKINCDRAESLGLRLVAMSTSFPFAAASAELPKSQQQEPPSPHSHTKHKQHHCSVYCDDSIPFYL